MDKPAKIVAEVARLVALVQPGFGAVVSAIEVAEHIATLFGGTVATASQPGRLEAASAERKRLGALLDEDIPPEED